MSNRKINLNYIADWKAKDNFDAIKKFVNDMVILGTNWKLLDLSYNDSQSNIKIRHGMTKAPLDVIITRKTGAGNVTINYEQFDDDYIDISVSGACKVRMIVGSMTSKRGEVL